MNFASEGRRSGVIDFTAMPNLPGAIRWASAQPQGEGFTEFLCATAAGRIALTGIMHHKARWSPHDLKSQLPAIVLIGDDAGHPRNPADWRCSIAAIAWARYAIVHGAGAERWHYAAAIEAAELTGRCLFVETDSEHAPAWLAAIAPRGIPGLSLIPRCGQRHPIEAAGGVDPVRGARS